MMRAASSVTANLGPFPLQQRAFYAGGAARTFWPGNDIVKVAEMHDPKQPSEKPVLSGSEKPGPVSETGSSARATSGPKIFRQVAGLGNRASVERE
jgi:hypothetical protein